MKLKLPFAVAGLAIGLAIGVLVALNISSNPQAESICQGKSGKTYTVMIMDGKVNPEHIAGKLCDEITITNHDNITRELAFGAHESHVPYDGVAERVLNRGESFTIRLNQIGSFHYHDHLHDDTNGYFTVAK